MECVMETLTKVIPSNVSALNKNLFLKRLNKFLLLSEATLLCVTGCHSGVSEETSKDDTSWSDSSDLNYVKYIYEKNISTLFYHFFHYITDNQLIFFTTFVTKKHIVEHFFLFSVSNS